MSDRSRRPGRRLPARVYWVRRGLVLSLVLLVGWGGTSLVSGGGDEAATTSDPGEQPAAVPDAPTPSGPLGRGGGGTGPGLQQGEPSPEQVVSPAAVVTTRLAPAGGDCSPGSVVVTPRVRGAARAGEPVQLELVLRGAKPSACRLRLGADQLLAQVVNPTGVTVWDVGDCPREIPVDAVTLRRGWQTVITLTWSGRRRDRTCVRATEPVEPGRYEVRAAVVGGEPARTDFELAAARLQT